MKKKYDSEYELDQAIKSSRGMNYLNRQHRRSFSLNIFLINAQELIEITQFVCDPEQGLSLFFQKNKEANLQAHREINRRIHNFVAAAKTLIDHTREFIREHYATTSIEKSYGIRIKSDFAEQPVAKFVQDLRNYMLHKGLPDSSFFMRGTNNSNTEKTDVKIMTGISYPVKKLLEWDKWTEPSKIYIKNAGDEILIQNFSEEYLNMVLQFHNWLDQELKEYHAIDLSELDELKNQYFKLETNSNIENIPLISNLSADNLQEPAKFEFSYEDSKKIDAIGNQILKQIKQIHLPQRKENTFRSERPHATITGEEILGHPAMWTIDNKGISVFVFIYSQAKSFGLTENSYATVHSLVDKILETKWTQSTTSRKFIENTIIQWCASSFLSKIKSSLATILSSECKKRIEPLEVWFPIAHLEIEESFEFGPVTIEPLSSPKFERLEKMSATSPEEQRGKIDLFFQNLRKEILGLATVVVHIEAEQDKAAEVSEALALSAISLLRFFLRQLIILGCYVP